MKKVTCSRSFAVYAALVVLCVLSASAKTEGRSRGAASSRAAATAVNDATVLNLRDFGAVGDAAADDGPALQRALDALASAGGGTLFVPAGRYAIYTPVRKDFTGVASSITIIGVESSATVAPTHSTGNEMTRGLALTSEFYPRTGAEQVAISIHGLRNLLVKHLAFVGTPGVRDDALITLALWDINHADIVHSEFYGLSSLSRGGSIVQAIRCSLRVEQTLFLGSTATSAFYTPVVQNLEWKGIAFKDVIFADYGQRPELYGKCHHAAPVSWINIGNAAPPTIDSPRREVTLRDVVLDEGGYWGLTALPYLYQPASAPIDLVYVSGLRMNVSNLGKIGHLLYNTQNVMVDRSTYEWNNTSASATTVLNVGHTIVSEITCLAGVRTISADSASQRLTVINSGCTNIESQAQTTTVVNNATADENPVEYVRARYVAVAGRAPEAAGHFYWSDQLIRCGENTQCRDERRAALAAYLATAPAPTFTLAGQAKDESGGALAGVTVALGGSQTVTTTTDAQGRYSFFNLPTSGKYTVAATATHYTFASKEVVTPAGNVTIDIPGQVKRHTISGRLANSNNAGMPGVEVKLFGSQTELTTTTNSAGIYSFTNVPAGRDYVVTPSHIHFAFTPTSRNISNLSGNQIADFSGSVKTFTIGGRIAQAGTAVSGVTVTLSGSQTATTTTDAAGNYSFSNLTVTGNYTITPSRTHYTFAPASLTFNNLSANQTGNFNAAPVTYNLGGRVTDGANNAVSGVTITVSGTQSKVATTDASGNYSITGLNGGGNYTVTPSRANYTFAPANLSFTNLSANQTGNFTATLNHYTIGGRISSAANAPLAGVTVTLGGAKSATATTDASGNYSFTNLPAGANYTVTPSLAHYTFAPSSSTFNNLSGNQAANFTATRNQHSIGGQIKDANKVALAGVTVTLSGGQAATTTTDASGNYSFANLTAGANYTVTPARQHYTFVPASATFTNLSANQAANFTASLNSHAISGRVTDSVGNALASVTLSLTGARTASVVSDANGNYTFTNLPAGSAYTITPALAHYTFAPAGRTFNALSADQRADFNGTLNLHKISGRITEGANGIAGVTVVLSGARSATTTTDPNGGYAFADLPAGGNYVVTPSRINYTFNPGSLSYGNLSANQTGNFTATLNQHTISGRISSAANAPLAGVTVMLGGAKSATATTDASGNYSFANLPASASYTVTPSLAHYTFAPSSSTFNNLSGNQTANFTATRNQHSIGGQIKDANKVALAGVTVTLSGGQAATTTTDASGNYWFANLLAGANYTVTPSLAHYTFAPSSLSFTDLSANQTANFTVARNQHGISGQIKDSSNAALAGVTVTLSGEQAATTTTDANGNYSFANLTAGASYTVTPSLAHYTFAPSSSTFNNLSGNQAANFTATRNQHGISGQIKDGNDAALPGVTVTLSGGQAATTATDASGNYSFANLPAGGNYTVTPARQHYTFAPQSLAFTNLTGDQTGANFSATFNRHSISGRVTDAAGVALAGATLELRGDQSATTTTDASGNYSFTGLPAGGNYTVAASKPNFTFTPPLRTFAALSGDQPGADFTVEAVSKTVQFEQVNYQVSEGSARVTLVVTRTGDTSEAATVEFTLGESAEVLPCITANGTANARCDYHSPTEVITFAPGENAKEITIQLIDDAHIEGAETLRLSLVSATGATLGTQSTATLLIQDNDAAPGQNPIYTTSFFVRMQYLDFLSREPEAGEPWSAILDGCSDVNDNPACDRVLVSQSFFGSPEFRLKGFYAFKFYSAAFNRRPAYDEITSDMGSMTAATPEEVYLKRAAMAVKFTESAEFKELYDGLGDASFVNALLDRYALQQITTPDPSNPEGGAKVVLTRADLASRLSASGAEFLTRAQVLRAVVESDEVAAAEFNRAFVAMQYYGYLRRTPEEDGYQAWLRVINEDPNNVRRMVNGFINSTEYQLRFGLPRTAGGGN